MVVLDTCAVLWLAFDRERLSEPTLAMVDREEDVIVSTMSVWEIGVKLRKKKLVMPCSLDDLVARLSANDRVALLAPDVATVVAALGLEWRHRDPIDRIVTATALRFGAPLVTADAAIRRFYPKTIS